MSIRELIRSTNLDQLTIEQDTRAQTAFSVLLDTVLPSSVRVPISLELVHATTGFLTTITEIFARNLDFIANLLAFIRCKASWEIIL